MRIRSNVLPRRLVDMLCFLVITIALPVVYFFEITIVLPEIHEKNGFLYTFTFLLAMFLVVNIASNMLACMMVDTSTALVKMSKEPNPDTMGWHRCKSCDKWAPPRSWHCNVCRVCILRRDHHCLFTGCCIGHKNQRYFICFILYLFIAACYALVYNSFFLWVLNGHLYRNWTSILKICCPMLFFLSGSVLHNMCLIVYMLNLIALGFSAIMLIDQIQTLVRGGGRYERKTGYPYNFGWRQNLRNAMGQRLFRALLFPLISSELPSEELSWRKSEKIIERNK